MNLAGQFAPKNHIGQIEADRISERIYLGSEAGILAPRSPEAAGRGGEVRSEETEKISLADLLAGN